MDNGATNSLVPTLFPELSLGNTTRARDRVVDFYQSFQSELGRLMKELADPETEEVEIDGIRLQKDSMALSFLLPEWQDRNNFILSQLLEAYKFEQTLENKLNNISFS